MNDILLTMDETYEEEFAYPADYCEDIEFTDSDTDED